MREQTGFKWQKKHQERSPVELRQGLKFQKYLVTKIVKYFLQIILTEMENKKFA